MVATRIFGWEYLLGTIAVISACVADIAGQTTIKKTKIKKE
jgi:hypothetical protein